MIRKLYIYLLLLVFILIACSKTIEFKPTNQEDLYFMLCALEVGSKPTVRMGKSLMFDDKQKFNYTCDASIELLFDNETHRLDQTILKNGICQRTNSNVTIKEDKSYKLLAKSSNFKMSSNITVLKMPIYHGEAMNGDFVGLRISKHFTDEGTIFDTSYIYTILLNYQRINLDKSFNNFGFGVSLKDTSLNYSFDVNLSCESRNSTLFPSIEQLCDKKVDGHTFDVELNLFVRERMENVAIMSRLYIIDDVLKSYFEKDIEQGTVLYEPFTVPSLPYSNVTGGVGIFGSYGVLIDTFNVKLGN